MRHEMPIWLLAAKITQKSEKREEAMRKNTFRVNLSDRYTVRDKDKAEFNLVSTESLDIFNLFV